MLASLGKREPNRPSIQSSAISIVSRSTAVMRKTLPLVANSAARTHLTHGKTNKNAARKWQPLEHPRTADR